MGRKMLSEMELKHSSNTGMLCIDYIQYVINRARLSTLKVGTS